MKRKIRDHRFHKKSQLLLEEIEKILSAYDHPITIRQIYYRLVAAQKIGNTMCDYRSVGNNKE